MEVREFGMRTQGADSFVSQSKLRIHSKCEREGSLLRAILLSLNRSIAPDEDPVAPTFVGMLGKQWLSQYLRHTVLQTLQDATASSIISSTSPHPKRFTRMALFSAPLTVLASTITLPYVDASMIHLSLGLLFTPEPLELPQRSWRL